jgi:hypothetical protein
MARFCALQARVAHAVVGFDEPNDCFCEQPDRGGLRPGHAARGHFRSTGSALSFIEEVVERELDRLEAASAPSVPTREDAE